MTHAHDDELHAAAKAAAVHNFDHGPNGSNGPNGKTGNFGHTASACDEFDQKEHAVHGRVVDGWTAGRRVRPGWGARTSWCSLWKPFSTGVRSCSAGCVRGVGRPERRKVDR